jgi:2-(1,2-epoxy-1,2-dihydrophenyl)acetyl-CoA isomerase
VPWSLERIVGGARMRELLFLRGKFDAQRALEIGLVSEVFPAERFRDDVAGVVDRLRNAPPQALRIMKANILDAERLSFADFVDVETKRHHGLVAGPEFRAGVEAFLRSRGGQ